MKKTYLLLALLLVFCRLSAQNLTDTENYIYKKTYLTGLADPVQKYSESVQYLDGLGRPKQIIDVKSTPLGNDLVIPIEYDEFGRKTKDYLPLPVQSLSTAIQPSVTVASVNSYYGVTNAFNEKDLEKSPLSRVFQNAFPGDTWKKNGGHTKKYDYDANSEADLVKQYQITTTWDNINQMYTSNLSQVIYYDENRLYKFIVKDEDNNEKIIFKDTYGHVILIRKNDGTNKIDTYYVYDEFDQLAYIVPPLASVSATLTSSVLNDLCYQYRYDSQKRVVEKKLPGKGWEYLVYDNQDRPVMTQDAKLGASLQWLFTKYDQYGRVAYTGIYTSAQNYNSAGRKYEQGEVNGKGYNNVTRTTTNFAKPGLLVYYDNDSAKNYPNTITKILSVNYYDTYPTGTPAIPTSILTQNVLQQNAQTSNSSTKSLPVASYLNNVETNGWTKSYNWYDTKGRTIGTHTVNHLGGYTKTESLLDFVGAPKETYTRHKRKNADLEIIVKEIFEYDNQYRLKVHKHQVNGGTEEILSQNSYDEIGRLITKKVGGTNINNPLQSVDYSYNIRNWITGINGGDISYDASQTSYILNSGKLFGYKIKYNDPNNASLGSAKFNGNIAELDWISKNTSLKRYGYQYDGLNRLLKGNYQDPANTLPETHINDEALTYDLNGNIKTLVRNSKHGKYYTPIVIDNLVYHYTGNRLTSIVDNPGATPNPSGYEGGGQPISYDPNGSGNMTAMPDKGISAIAYNFLDLPTQINQRANTIKYYYRADGTKVKKQFTLVNSSGTKIINTEYLDGFQYSTPNTDPLRKALEAKDDTTMLVKAAGEEEAFSMDTERKIAVVYPSNPQQDLMILSFFPTSEGYYDYENLRYIYQYKDHIGNVRVSYVKNPDNTLKVMDTNDYYPFGMNFLKGNQATIYDPLTIPYNYKFQEQELQETGFYAFKWRNYMPDVGRFFNPDPLSEKYAYQSHYNFSENRVTDGRELEGLEVEILNDAGDMSVNGYGLSHSEYTTGSDGTINIQEIVLQGPSANNSGTSNNSFGWGDVGRTAIGFVPFVGSGLDIYEGARDGNWMMLGVGVAGLALDVATLGSGSLIKGGVKAIGTELAEEGLELATKEIAKDVAEEGAQVVAKRGSFRKGTVKDSWDNAKDGSKTNTKQCPTCKKDVEGNPHKNEKRNGLNGWDVSHNPSWSNRNHKGTTRKQQLDDYNNGVDLECKSCNRSGGNNDSRFEKR